MRPKRRMKFEIFQGEDGRWYWHLKSGNGRVVEQGQSHPTWRGARAAVERMQDYDRNGALVQAKVVSP